MVSPLNGSQQTAKLEEINKKSDLSNTPATKDVPILTSSDLHILRLIKSFDNSKPNTDFELSYHFGIVTDGEGKDAKGVFPNTNSIHSDIDALKTAVKGNYLIFAQSDPNNQTIKLTLIKKGVNDTLQYFDKTTNSFLPITNEILSKLKIKEEDRCIEIGIGTEDPQSFVFKSPTPSSNITQNLLSNKRFYQERQSGLLCGYHAINAFCGDRLFSLQEYAEKSSKLLHGKVDIPLEEYQAILGDYSPLESTDTGIILELIKSLSKDGILPIDGGNAKILEISSVENRRKIQELPQWQTISKELSDPKIDRVIVGWGADHFIALRKTSEGNWHAVDSQNNDSQDKTYKSIDEFISHYERPGLEPKNFSFVFISSKNSLQTEEINKKLIKV